MTYFTRGISSCPRSSHISRQERSCWVRVSLLWHLQNEGVLKTSGTGSVAEFRVGVLRNLS